MSKKITPCEKLGYNVGDKFRVVDGTGVHYAVGSFITLIHDDGSSCPRFNGVHAIFGSGDSFFPLDFVEKVAKLKPAKQALADAIHQNGGWRHGAEYAAQDKCAQATMFRSKPIRHGNTWLDDEGFDDVGGFGCDKIQNWHQCILSRDEYFTAYPEQVKVEICNETKHKVEVEMESESEMTIKAGDWHKNGELPPVGAFVDVVGDSLIYGQAESNCEVIAHVENTAVIRMSYGLGCFESGAIIPARTEREKAIDAMMLECQYAGDSVDKCKRFAIALYDAGYRKEVK